MWDLFFRLRADNSPLQKDMVKSGAFFDSWASKQSKKMGETFWKGISLATVGGIAVHGFSAATKAAEELTRMAAQTGRTIEEMALLNEVSKETGKTITDLVEALKGGGPAAEELKRQMKGSVVLHPKITANYAAAGENLRGLGGAAKSMGTLAGVLPVSLFNVVAEPFRLFTGLLMAAKRGDMGMAKSALSDSSMRMLSPLKWQEKQLSRLRELALPASGDMSEIDDFYKRQQAGKDYRQGVNESMEAARKEAEGKRVAALAYMRPSADADALSRVGIFTARAGAEDRQYQRDSLSYLSAISTNTAKQWSTVIPDPEPWDVQ